MFDLTDHGTIKAKGYDNPVAVFAPSLASEEHFTMEDVMVKVGNTTVAVGPTKLRLLRNVGPLGKLSNEVLAPVAVALETRNFEAGQSIIREKDSGYGFYIIASGVCNIWAPGSNEEHALRTGDHFGEVPCTVYAESEVTCVMIPRFVFDGLAIDAAEFEKGSAVRGGGVEDAGSKRGIVERFDRLEAAEQAVLKSAAILAAEPRKSRLEFQALVEIVRPGEGQRAVTFTQNALSGLIGAGFLRECSKKKEEICDGDDSEASKYQRMQRARRALTAAEFEFVDKSVIPHIDKLMLREKVGEMHDRASAFFAAKLTEPCFKFYGKIEPPSEMAGLVETPRSRAAVERKAEGLLDGLWEEVSEIERRTGVSLLYHARTGMPTSLLVAVAALDRYAKFLKNPPKQVAEVTGKDNIREVEKNEGSHGEDPELWCIDGYVIDIVGGKYKIGTQKWYLRERAQDAIRLRQPIAGQPINEKADNANRDYRQDDEPEPDAEPPYVDGFMFFEEEDPEYEAGGEDAAASNANSRVGRWDGRPQYDEDERYLRDHDYERPRRDDYQHRRCSHACMHACVQPSSHTHTHTPPPPVPPLEPGLYAPCVQP